MRSTALSSPLAASPKPLYAQVRDLLVQRIRDGDWSEGGALPNEVVLSTQFGVSVGTVRRAVEELEGTGVLRRKQGRGTFVTSTAREAPADRFGALERCDGTLLSPSYQLLGLGRRPATRIESEALALPGGADALEVRQLLIDRNTPVGLEIAVFSARLLPRLETQLQFGQPLYGVLAGYGIYVTSVAEAIGASPGEPALAEALGAVPGDPMLRVTRKAKSFEDRPVEHRVTHLIAARAVYRRHGV